MANQSQRKPIITGLYCSKIGHAISNAEVHKVNKKSLKGSVSKEAEGLYEKLLLREPERKRQFVNPYEDVSGNLSAVEKAERFEKVSLSLLADAAEGVLEQLQLEPKDVDLLIVNYMAGKTLPSLAARLHGHLEMRTDCDVVTLGDMGCSAAVAALDVAVKMLAGQKGAKRAMVVSTEPVSNLFQKDNDKGAVVGNTLFGEGCAAVMLSTHREAALFEIEGAQRVIQTDEESLNVITLAHNEHGPMIQLSKKIPEVAGRAIEKNLRRLVPQFLPLTDKLKFAVTKKVPKWQRHIDWWAIHPGGTSVLDGFRKQMKLSKADLGPSYQVFHERSNMSSPSVLYALEHVEARGCKKRDRVMLMSFGSGFKVNAMILRRGGRRSPMPRRKVAVVVGGTSGIGLDTAKQLAAEGYTLFIGSRRATSKPEDFERIEGASYFQLDVSDARSVKDFADRVWRQTFGVDSLVLSSGVSAAGPSVGNLDDENISRVIDTNLSGAVSVVNAFVPLMRNRGKVILLNSILGKIPMMGSAVYCASKAGLEHFVHATELEFKRKGRNLTVKNIYPAYVKTPMLDEVTQNGRTFLKPVETDTVSRAITALSEDSDASNHNGYLLSRDRLIVALYKYLPTLYKKVVTSL